MSAKPDTQALIIDLTSQWVDDCGGRDLVVCVGAALNVAVTCGKHGPPEMRKIVADSLRRAALLLEAP